ncbi:MAG: hypothetical protein BWY59_01131 [Verrucomicrobia bacterium ADurb.Bin345]|nr:MAG: hypothetical protein BWY59_01131 [Verrucomicrobia bacterium ADurb.Bin345]
MAVADLVALVAQALPHLLEERGGVDQLDLALAGLLFAVGQDPDVGADAGVVEQLVRHGDDSLQPVVLDDPAADLALARAGSAGKQRRTVEHDGQSRTAVLGLLALAEHVEKEEQCAVIDPGQAGAEPAAEALLLVFLDDDILLGLPLHAERRVGQHVVEMLAVELVVGEAVAELDVVDVLALDHHVRPADGVRLVVVVLAEHLQPGIGVQFPDIVLGHGQHAAGAAGGVVLRLDDALLRQDVGVGAEQQIDHEPDDFPRREMVARLLVAGLVEPPDQLLEDVTHLQVGDRVRVQIDLAELRYDEVQPVRLIQLADVLLEPEVLDDFAGAGGESLDEVGEVGGDVLRVALQLLERELAGVVERLACDLVQDRLQVLHLATLHRVVLRQHLLLRRLQDAVQPPEHGQGQHHVLVLVGPVRPPKNIRYGPDEADFLAEVFQRHELQILPCPDGQHTCHFYQIRRS